MTIICGDQPFSPTRLPDASESRSWFSVAQPDTSFFKTAVPSSLDLLVQSTVLPSVTPILGTGVADVNPPHAAIPSVSGDCFAVETSVCEGNPPGEEETDSSDIDICGTSNSAAKGWYLLRFSCFVFLRCWDAYLFIYRRTKIRRT